MSCFWDGLLQSVTDQDFQRLGLKLDLDSDRPRTPKKLITWLKRHNTSFQGSWDGQSFSRQQQRENREWIDSLDPSQSHNGYLCSSCDPVIALWCQLFQLEILHQYLGHSHRYLPSNNSSIRKIKFKNTRGHFVCVR